MISHSATLDTGLPEPGGWLERRHWIALGLWTGAATLLAGSGVFQRLPMESFAILVFALTAGLTIAYFTGGPVRRLFERLGPRRIAALHVWRIAAAAVFIAYGAMDLLPELFATLAGYGDLLAGLLALAVIAAPLGARLLLGFHVVGMIDFVVAVGTGLTLTWLAVPLMENVATLPVALIPLVGVPLSGASHVAAMHMMWRERNA